MLESSGIIREEFLRDLDGDKAIKVYREMWLNNPIIGGAVRAITLLARQVPWRIDGDETDERIEFLETARDDMSSTWETYLSEILTGVVVFGWDYREVVYKVRAGANLRPGRGSKYADGLIGWRKFAPRSQDSRVRWQFDRTDGQTLEGMWQYKLPRWEQVYIPIEKALLFRLETHKDNPEGQSMLRTAYRAWYFCKRMEEVEGIGVERDLAGLPVIEVPAEITASDAPAASQAIYQEMKKIVKNVRRGEQMGVVLPQSYDGKGNKTYTLSLLASGGKRQIETNEIINRYAAQMAMSLLADFIVLGHEKVGSFALADSKTNLFAVALGTLLQSVASVMNRHAIPRLLALNGFPLDEAPQLAHGDIETTDLKAFAEGFGALVSAGGIVPTPQDEAWIRREYKLPAFDEAMRDEILNEQRAQDAKEMEQAAQDRQPQKESA